MGDSILVVGAAGFVGQVLVSALALRGDRVIGTSRSVVPPGIAAEVLALPGREAADYAPLLPRCRAVVHVASSSSPGLSAARPLAELDENLRPTLALLQALQEHPHIPLVFLSSGGALYRAEGIAAEEDAALDSRSYHGAGKISAEHFIQAWCHQYEGSATILRPSNLYGPGQRERDGFGLIPAALGRILRGETMHVWGDGSARRDYLFIEDFLRLCLAVLDAPLEAGCNVFNACSGTSTSLDEVLAAVEDIAGRKLQRRYEADRRVDAPDVRMSARRAQQRFGWRAEHGLREGLEQTWRWFTAIAR